jgi:hypothetical protein
VTDEFVLDTAVVREFVAAVSRRGLALPGSPEDACAAIRPALRRRCSRTRRGCRTSTRRPHPRAGMGGGIGQWLLFRAGDGSLSAVLAGRPSRRADAGARPPRVGARRPVPRDPGRGDLCRARRRRSRSSSAARWRPATSTTCFRPRTTSTASGRRRPRRRSRSTC